MLIKFDHIAFTCETKVMDDVIESFDGYEMMFCEMNVDNLTIKYDIMANIQDKHNICLLEKRGEIPIEITAYKHVSIYPEHYKIANDGSIVVNTYDPGLSELFYLAIGFKKSENGLLELRTIMDTQSLKLDIFKSEHTQKTGLDNYGHSCMAFITNKIAKEKKKIENCGIRVTEVMDIMLHERKMSICFAYNNLGDICELIQVRD